MSVENELKIIPREELKPVELLNLLIDNGFTANGKLKLSKQEDTYYDDKEGTLEKTGCSFRIRRKGNGAVVTYKSPIKSDTEYKQREELEAEISDIYIQEDGSILIEDAIDVLRKKYPDIELPRNLQVAVTVINNRNKVNIKSEDGTIIELAFDDLNIRDGKQMLYGMNNEIECEVITGNPDNLTNIYNIIGSYYDIAKNELSKYSRAVKEMNEQRDNMTLDEITICAMLSDIINAKEFEQLKYKGQMIHDYRKDIPENLSLDNFKDPEYLINKISEVKRIKNYRPGKIKNLEEMFLCFFSDMSYKEIEYKLVKFLNDNYYSENAPITNRMLHSQQVMLITGLISRSKEISEGEKKTLLSMTSALLHDIGHVPGAHPTEEIFGNLDGFFSHEINGRNVIERIILKDEEKILDVIKEYYESLGRKYSEEICRDHLQKNKTQIKRSIEAHSRTNSEQRGDGTVVQLPREADKICYCISDIVDILKRVNHEASPEFFPVGWKDEMTKKLGKGYEKGEVIKQKIEEIEKLINTSNFGEIATTIANTVVENINDGKTYYDVDQDYWDIVNGMIKYVKDLRAEGVVDNKRKQLQLAAQIFILKNFNEFLAQTNGNVELAWDRTIETVTQSNDLDILNCINLIKEMYNDKENRDQLLRTAYEEGGILDTSKLAYLDNSDRQIKMQPRGKFQIIDLQPYLGNKYDISHPEVIKDTYYMQQNGLSICLREYKGTQNRQLIVKRKRDKEGVTQVEREKYVSNTFKDITLEELVRKFNEKHPDFNIQVPEGEPRCIIQTIRSNVENEQGVVIRKDKSTVIAKQGKIEMPETIEIECNDRNGIKSVKQKLNSFLDMIGTNLRAVSTKETKEEQAMRLISEQEQYRE